MKLFNDYGTAMMIPSPLLKPALLHFCCCAALLLVALAPAKAQDSLRAKQELWPELDVYYKFNNQLRLNLQLAATRGRDFNYTDGSASIYGDYYLHSSFSKNQAGPDSTADYYLWLRAGYIFDASVANTKDQNKENIILTEANNRIHLPWQIMGEVQNRVDWRIGNNKLVVRYRPMLKVGRDFKTEYLTFNGYIYSEYFCNLGNSSTNRLRLCVGAEIKITRIFSFEVYWLQQFSHQPAVDEVSAAGISVKAYLKSRKVHR